MYMDVYVHLRTYIHKVQYKPNMYSQYTTHLVLNEDTLSWTWGSSIPEERVSPLGLSLSSSSALLPPIPSSARPPTPHESFSIKQQKN